MPVVTFGPAASRRAGVLPALLGLIGGSLAFGAAATPAAMAAALCSDNLVVSRVGDGSAALSSVGTAVFLDEYTRSGTFVQTIALPTAASGANRRLVNSGSASSNLGLARSADGRYLTLAGYDAALGTVGVTGSAATAVNRVVARVDGAGAVDTTTALTDAFSGDNFRSAVTDDGSQFWLGGSSAGSPASGGVRLATLGATTSTSVSTTNNNMRWVTIQGGQLYVTSGSGTNIGLNQVGTGLPTAAGQVATRVIDTTNGGANSSSPYGALLLDRSAAVAGLDTAYLADDQGSGAGGLRKYSFDGTTWTAQGRIAATLRGVAGVGDATSAKLWVTTSTNQVQALTDTAAFDAPINGSLVAIVTGATNTAIRGIALAPDTGTGCSVAAPSITDQPDGTTVASGDTATLGVTATGTAPLTYQWYQGLSGDTTNPVGGATGDSFTTPPLTSTTSYWVRVSNAAGSTDSQTATVTVTAAGNSAPTISSPPPLADADDDPSGPTTTVTVGDAETPVASLVVTATSSNQAVLADGGILVSGSGATRTLAFDPAGVGYATVTIRVTDGGGLFAESTLSYAASAPAAVPGTTRFHHGAADASTAADAGGGFAFVADDENQAIRLYDTTTSGMPVASFDFTADLALTDLSGGIPREVDIEASARVGNRIYWLASHGNSSSGSNRPNRQRLFATDVTGTGASATLSFVGFYSGLRTDLIAWDDANGHGLGAGHYGLAASAATGTAPEAADPASTPAGQGRGFNIEGLEFAPDGTTAYLAFRAPNVGVPARPNALVVPVSNLASLVTAGGPATFAAPFEWDLDLGGVREIRKNAANQYVILSGRAAAGDPTQQALWSWDGNPATTPVRRGADLATGNGGGSPQGSYEAIAPLPDVLTGTSALRLFADSGDTVWYGDGVIAKALPTPEFRKSHSSVFVLGGVPARIHDIQGAGHISPFAAANITDPGQAVSGVPGVVTARRSNGFYLEDPVPDVDPATSEGIFVFTGTAPPAAAAVGNLVSVSGTVTEFRPGCTPSCSPTASAFDNLTVTQITGPTVTLVSTGNPLPVTTVGGLGTDRTPPLAIIEDDAAGNVELGNTFDPATDGLDFYESLEAMQIRIDDPEVVSRKNFEVVVVPGDLAAAGPRSPRGGIVLPGYEDRNPERIFLADSPRLNGLGGLPSPDVGDSFEADVTGVLFYDFGNYVLLPSQALPALVDGDLQREVTTLVGGAPGQVTIGTFNVENLDFLEPQAKFDGLAAQIVTNMGAPDVVVVQEIQDDNGAATGGVNADQTWNRLIAAIDALPDGPTYQFRQIDPAPGNPDGGEPNGNIRQGFLFRTDRGVAFVDRPGATATTPNAVQVVDGRPRLTFSPGRIDPANTAFNNSRKPLAGEFTFAGRTFFVVGNHWNSKGGDDPEFGRFQPPVLNSEVQRQQQAVAVRDFVEQIQDADPDAAIVVAGDLNDYQFSNPVRTLTDVGYTSLVTTLPVGERYGYVFDGNSQVLDHIVVSDNLVPVAEYDTVHINAEFADQLSDHDPSVARLRLAPPDPDLVVTKTATPDPVVAGGTLTYSIGVSNTVAGSSATDVTLTDPVPAGTTFVSATAPAGWSCTPQAAGSTDPLSCSRAALTAADGVQAFTLVVRVVNQVASGTSIANTATVSSTPADSGPGANAASTVTAVSFPRSLPAVVVDKVDWTLHGALATVGPDVTFTLGTKPLQPLTGDWDGDGSKTPGFYQAGTFNLSNSATATQAVDISFAFGDRRGYPVAGDFNGDGTDDVAVYRDGIWQVRYSTGTVLAPFSFGLRRSWPATVPVAGDWDGDGTDGIGTFTAATGTWNLNHTADSSPADIGPFVYWAGRGTDSYPVVGDWNGDGVDTVGIRSAGSAWSLNDANDSSGPDIPRFTFGPANARPLAWRPR